LSGPGGRLGRLGFRARLRRLRAGARKVLAQPVRAAFAGASAVPAPVSTIAGRLLVLVGASSGRRATVRALGMVALGRREEALALYRWFLPLLRMDTVPKFVQLIKLAQVAVGMGSARVRPPRLELVGAEYDEAMVLIRERLATLPSASGVADRAPAGVHSTAAARGALQGDAIVR
jgi:hypothetical protein